jgi:hypothetical protein
VCGKLATPPDDHSLSVRVTRGPEDSTVIINGAWVVSVKPAPSCA